MEVSQDGAIHKIVTIELCLKLLIVIWNLKFTLSYVINIYHFSLFNLNLSLLMVNGIRELLGVRQTTIIECKGPKSFLFWLDF